MAEFIGVGNGKMINLNAIAYTVEWDGSDRYGPGITVFWCVSPQVEDISLPLAHTVFRGKEATTLLAWVEKAAYPACDL